MNVNSMKTVSLQKRGVVFFLLVGLLSGLGIVGSPDSARATGNLPFIGEIGCGGWNFCPLGWADCNGQLMAISGNDALFNLIGTTYGGDGQSTFALPNLSGRTMLGTGTGTTGSTYVQGQPGGSETVTLNSTHIPSHNHAVQAQSASGDSASPTGKLPGGVASGDARYSTTATGTLHTAAVGVVGNSQRHNNLQPYLAVKCCIAVEGIFPSP